MNNSGTGYVFLVTDAELKNCDVRLRGEFRRSLSSSLRFRAQPPAPSKQFHYRKAYSPDFFEQLPILNLARRVVANCSTV